MRILVDPGNYDLDGGGRNLGCLAVLQAGLQRLGTTFPTATIRVLTTNVQALARHCLGVEPVPVDLGSYWYAPSWALSRVRNRLPLTAAKRVVAWESALRLRSPEAVSRSVQFKSRLLGRDVASVRCLVDAIASADLVVTTGVGGLRGIEVNVLTTLEAAIGYGVPTAMLGVGLNGYHAPLLLARMAEVLPRVGLIAVRERLVAPRLLQSLGVRAERIRVTGDDAVGLAYSRLSPVLGDGIGINLRVSPEGSADVDPGFIPRLRPVLHACARRWEAPLVPLPSANGIAYPDGAAARQLVIGDGENAGEPWIANSPAELLSRTQRCRVVITGAYHVAVFALAQGIPAICLVRSEFFREKMSGLADLFGAGCRIVELDAPDLEARLVATCDEAWLAAEGDRPRLLAAAAEQARWSAATVDELQALLPSPTEPAPGVVDRLQRGPPPAHGMVARAILDGEHRV